MKATDHFETNALAGNLTFCDCDKSFVHNSRIESTRESGTESGKKPYLGGKKLFLKLILLPIIIYHRWKNSFVYLDIKIVPVTKEYKNKPLQIKMLQSNEENIVDIPSENYDIFKGKC